MKLSHSLNDSYIFSYLDNPSMEDYIKKINNLSEDRIKEYLDKLRDSDIAKHYRREESGMCHFDNSEAIKKYLIMNQPFKMKVDGNVVYYCSNNNTDSTYSTVEEEHEGKIVDEFTLFDIDVENSFIESDKWLYDKITPVDAIFVNPDTSKLTSEQNSMFICLVIASVMGGEFLEEITEVLDNYDVPSWSAVDSSKTLNFKDLYKEWVQLGSKTIKMIAAAAKYALLRERTKKQFTLALGLPQEQASKLVNLRRNVSNIRYEFDEVKLSASNREKLSKLEVKMIIAQRDMKIQETVQADSKLYQLWRLSNLNSNVIDPSLLRNFIREARRRAPSIFEDVFGSEVALTHDEKLLLLKKLQDKLKKEAIRACLNKMFAEEVLKFKNNPDSYTAPNFV